MPAAISAVNWGAHRRLERAADGTRWRQLLRWSSPDGLPRALVLAVSQTLPDADDVGGANAHGGALLQLQWGAGGAWHQAEADPGARFDVHAAELTCRARLRADDADAWPSVDLTATVGPGPRGYEGAVRLTDTPRDIANGATAEWPVPPFARAVRIYAATTGFYAGSYFFRWLGGSAAGTRRLGDGLGTDMRMGLVQGNAAGLTVPGHAYALEVINTTGGDVARVTPVWGLDL